jgi:hypothetical protein
MLVLTGVLGGVAVFGIWGLLLGGGCGHTVEHLRPHLQVRVKGNVANRHRSRNSRK